MKKRTILILLLCVMAMGFAFAGKVNISAQVSPFSVQVVSASNGTFVSTYGFGAGIGGGENGDGGTITISGGTVYAVSDVVGIGAGAGDGTVDGTLTRGPGVELQVSENGFEWTDYVTEPEENRKKYMKTK
ncbi:MAG: hypothetical protein II753_06270 [Spirochaetales bacterium]|nr:hypothetical protein [Spirochaetales bacterium]